MVDNQEHGTFDVYCRGQMMFCILGGQWNLETAVGYFKEAKKNVLSLAGKPWGQIVDYNDWQLMVPETVKPNYEFQDWLHHQGLQYKAIIIQSKINIEILKSRVKNYDNINLKIFEKEQEAVDWLKSKGISDQ